MFADYATDDYRVIDQNSPEASTITVSFNNKKTNYSWFLGLDIRAAYISDLARVGCRSSGCGSGWRARESCLC